MGRTLGCPLAETLSKGMFSRRRRRHKNRVIGEGLDLLVPFRGDRDDLSRRLLETLNGPRAADAQHRNHVQFETEEG